ncbi:MAG: aminotransferase class I/II-fold pyridoxal phosphate-dependent enzyme [Sphingobacteriia bacterium]|nr:aminotransferase class I/II-fold pyridoxal phosphate-dependent enzyme [Sphingobacteriia bacterium]
MDKNLQGIFDNVKAYCDNNFKFDFNPANPIVRLHEPTFSHEEINVAVATMLSTFVTMGKQNREFEELYAKKFGHKYGVTNNSGSSANLLAVATLANPATPNHLKPGDEVIVPSLSWSTTVWPLVQHGLVPVFVDCDLKTFNLDLEKLEKAITPKTRAIKLVHVYGNPCDMDPLLEIAKKHNLFVIEDSCESMGAKYKGKYVGSFGDIGTFSFFFSHHITTLEGGICTTDNFDYAETMRVLRAHGWSREADEKQKYIDMYPEIDPRFIFINHGYNVRITEVQAAMGKEQLKKFDAIAARRRRNAELYRKGLEEFSDLFHFQEEMHDSESTWFGYGLVLKENVKFDLKEINAYLQSNKIETRPIIAGNMTKHPALKMFDHRIAGTLENSDKIMQRGFAFGCHHAINDEGCAYVIEQIKNFIKTKYESTQESNQKAFV